MNDWMDQEVLRQAAEAGDPSAQTASWAMPSRRQTALPAVPLFAVLAVLSLVVVLTALAAAAMR
jgi:hypothetical protein